MEKCRQMMEDLTRTMAELEAQALNEELLKKTNAQLSSTVAKSLEDAKIVYMNTTTMDDHLLGLERTMSSMKTSIEVSQMQHEVSECHRKKLSEELSILHGTVTDVSRDVGNAMQIMQSLLVRVHDVNAKLLLLTNNDFSPSGGSKMKEYVVMSHPSTQYTQTWFLIQFSLYEYV